MVRSLHARKDYRMCTVTKICGWMGIRRNSTTQSRSFAKYSDVGLVKISFPVCCVLHRATGLPTGMSHRAACGWSQVALTLALCGPVPLPHVVSRQWLVVVSYGMRLATSTSLSSLFLKAAGLSCLTTTAESWFQSPTVLTANELRSIFQG